MLAATTVLLLTLLFTFSLHHATAHIMSTKCCIKYAQKPVQYVKIYKMPRGYSLLAVVIVAVTADEI